MGQVCARLDRLDERLVWRGRGHGASRGIKITKRDWITYAVVYGVMLVVVLVTQVLVAADVGPYLVGGGSFIAGLIATPVVLRRHRDELRSATHTDLDDGPAYSYLRPNASPDAHPLDCRSGRCHLPRWKRSG